MRCPGCHQDALGARQRVLVALRAEARCPACGVVIRFGLWPRLVHSLFGDVVLLGGIAGTLWWKAPFLVVLAAASWLTLALVLPIETGKGDV